MFCVPVVVVTEFIFSFLAKPLHHFQSGASWQNSNSLARCATSATLFNGAIRFFGSAFAFLKS